MVSSVQAHEAVTAPHWGEPVRAMFSRNGYRFGAVGEGGVVALWRSDMVDAVSAAGAVWLGMPVMLLTGIRLQGWLVAGGLPAASVWSVQHAACRLLTSFCASTGKLLPQHVCCQEVAGSIATCRCRRALQQGAGYACLLTPACP
jgi:hypothetical protein